MARSKADVATKRGVSTILRQMLRIYHSASGSEINDAIAQSLLVYHLTHDDFEHMLVYWPGLAPCDLQFLNSSLGFCCKFLYTSCSMGVCTYSWTLFTTILFLLYT